MILDDICEELGINQHVLASMVFGGEYAFDVSSGLDEDSYKLFKFMFKDKKSDYIYITLSYINEYLKQTEHFKNISIIEIQQFGGEGQGDDCWVVIEIKNLEDHIGYFKNSGWYNSYEGASFEGDFFEVKPVQVIKTEYHKV